jgi:hypothetical protein
MPSQLAFIPYEGWETDLLCVLRISGVSPGAASLRLREALQPAVCGKKICHSSRSHPSWRPPLKLTIEDHEVELVCRKPFDHKGPHLPDIPPECWA